MNRRRFLGAVAAPLLVGGFASPALARGRGGNLVALVTADTQARIVAVEVPSGRVIGSIRTQAWPRGVETLRGLAGALVAHPEEGVVTLLDGLRVRAVLEGLETPRYAALHPEGSVVYVTDSGAGTLAVVDPARARVVRRLDLGGPARHVSISGDGRVLWTALGGKAREIAVVDVREPRRPRLLRTIMPPWRAHDVGFAPAGNTVWVTSGDRSELALYDRRASTPRKLLAANAPPQHVAFLSFGQGAAYVTSGVDGTMRTHRLHGARLRSASVPVGSYNVTSNGSWVVAPSLTRGLLTVADAAGRPAHQVRVAPAAHDACLLVL